MEGFVECLLLELDALQKQLSLRPETIFFGGGTPSALPIELLEKLLLGLRQRLDLSRLIEWTLEMNPATVSSEKALCLRELGVNRISMGVQSWENSVLGTLGRVHSAEQAEQSYLILRDAGFKNINIDLMFAVPGQTLEGWRDTLAKTLALAPEHISAYNLTYEEDTEFFQRLGQGDFSIDEEREVEFFTMTAEFLNGAGYEQYEVSNFSQLTMECRHNLAYWQGEDFVGLGPSAVSTCGSERWKNIPNTREYEQRVRAGEIPPESFRESLTQDTKLKEKVAFSLRTKYGVEKTLLQAWAPEVSELLDSGLIEETSRGSHFTLTQKGRLLADQVAAMFF